MIPIISLVGRSNSGKTTLIEKLIKIFKDQNYRIAVIKHTHHDFSFDKKGKDSYRHRDAGADTVLITNDSKIGMVSDLEKPMNPLEVAEKFLSQNIDLLIIEGFKDLASPKIEIIGDSEEAPLFQSGLTGVRAVVTDRDIETDLPQFRRNDIHLISEYIKKEILT